MTKSEPLQGAPQSVPAAPETLAGLVAHRAHTTPDALLVVDDRNRHLTAMEFHQECTRVATNFEGLGVAAGQLVSWIMPTGIDALLIMVGLSTVGAAQNPIIPMYGAREIGHIFREASVDAVVSVRSHRSTDYEQMIGDLVDPASGRPRVVDVDRVFGGQSVLADSGERGTPSHVSASDAQWSSTRQARRVSPRACCTRTGPSTPSPAPWPVVSR